MAPRWRRAGTVSSVLFLFLSAAMSNSRTVKDQPPLSRTPKLAPLSVRTFEVEIRCDLDPVACETLSAEAADTADETGELGGNALYQDLRGASWSQVRALLEVERALVQRIGSSPDPAAAEAEYEAERDTDPDNLEGLSGLDVGVAAAASALSALGATPFISCNAGTFGTRHPARQPYVAFYLSAASPALLLALAEAASVGLQVLDGKITLYARSVLDLQRFAQSALDWADGA